MLASGHDVLVIAGVEISDKEKNERIKAIAPEFTSAKEKLSEEDKGYINRLTNAITLNFLYAK